jgi:hypothetical protein
VSRSTLVFKGSPEELQTLSEVEALVSELKTMMGASPSVTQGQGLDAFAPGQDAQMDQAPGYDDGDVVDQGYQDAQSGDEPPKEEGYDPKNEPDGDEAPDPRTAGKFRNGGPNAAKSTAEEFYFEGEEPNMNLRNGVYKGSTMIGVDGMRTRTPETTATAPNGSGDDNWGEGDFGAPDDEGMPEASKQGAGIQDDGAKPGRYSAFKSQALARKAALEAELAQVNKAIEGTPHNGHDSLDSADEIIGDLPQYDIDDIDDLSRSTGASPKAVEKMLEAIGRRHQQKVAKSIQNHEMTVLRTTVQKQSQILNEVLAGIQAAATGAPLPPELPRTVTKSARPQAAYPMDTQGGSIIDQLADAIVKKSAGTGRPGVQSTYGDPELDALLADDQGQAPGNNQAVHKSMQAFTGLFGRNGLWNAN